MKYKLFAGATSATIIMTSLAACGGGNQTTYLADSNPEQACADLISKSRIDKGSIDSATFLAAGSAIPGSTIKVEQAICRITTTSRPTAILI